MPARKKPTFLKRQKELQRVARANEKREARRARKHVKNLGIVDDADTPDLDPTVEETFEEPAEGAPETEA